MRAALLVLGPLFSCAGAVGGRSYSAGRSYFLVQAVQWPNSSVCLENKIASLLCHGFLI